MGPAVHHQEIQTEVGSEVDVEVLYFIVDVKGVVRHEAVIVTMAFGPDSFTVHGCKLAIHLLFFCFLPVVCLCTVEESFLQCIDG